MNTENIIKAHQTAQLLSADIREAYKDSNPLAEIILYDLIEAAVKIEQKLKRLAGACE